MTQPALKQNPDIQFIDLAAQQERIKTEIDTAISNVLSHGKYIMGPEVKELENVLSSFLNVKHTVSCSSGTDALVMALMALDVKAGDAVLVPSFTFAATAEAVAILGAIPVFIDIDERHYNITLESVQDAYSAAQNEGLNVVGLISVDLFGLCADYEGLEGFTKDKNIWLMADAAQSMGAEYNGKKIGNYGDVTTTSFFPAKPLGCYGDGGAIFTNNDDLAAKMESIRVHGKGSDKYDNVRLGVNGRLDTLQAAILLEKQKIFADEIEKRNHVAAYYNKNLEGVLPTPVIPENGTCVWAQYTLQAKDEAHRSHIQSALKESGVPMAVYYPMPLHQQTAYKHYPAAKDMSTCERLSKCVFSLPMHPYLEPDTQDYIIEAVKKAAA